MNIVLSTDIQKDEAKSALLNLAVRILSLIAKASSEDLDTILSSSTNSKGTCDKKDFEKFLDQRGQS